MHSLAWDDPGDEKDAHNAIKTSIPGQVIDLPKPPDHIIVDIKLSSQYGESNGLTISTFQQILI
jgi:hypothetical protein